MDQMKIGNFLKELRKEKGLTQEQLASALNVSNRTVSRWETGSNMPDISMLVELSQFYDVSIPEMIDGGKKIMNEEVKESALKIADYANEENATILKRVQAIAFVGLFSAIITLLLNDIDIPKIPVFYFLKGTFEGLVIGALITTILFTTGKLFKLKKYKSKHMKLIAVCVIIVCFGLFLASVVASL